MRPFVFCALLFTVAPALAAPAPKTGSTGDAAELADKLMEKVDFDRAPPTGIRAALDLFQEKTGVTVLLDYRAIRDARGEEMPAIDDLSVTFQAVKAVRGETVLRHLADQIQTVIYYTSDHVLLTTPQEMADKIGVGRGPSMLVCANSPEEQAVGGEHSIGSAAFVTASYRDLPLADALRSMSLRANRTAVIAVEAAEKAKSPVTASLANVPFETAVSTLAEAAGLRAVRNGNTILVVTQARAKELFETENRTMVGVGNAVLSLQDLQAIAKLFPGKADPESVQKEVNRLKAEKAK